MSSRATLQRRQPRESAVSAEQQTRAAVPRDQWIATAAYFLAERRHARGEASDELHDWLEAEQAYARLLESPAASNTLDQVIR